jgi:enamine deaminase RidA (YjgF/YER057c/UK114 family)
MNTTDPQVDRMTDTRRRGLIKAPAAAAFAAVSASAGMCAAADVLGLSSSKGRHVEIERFGLTPAIAGIPLISYATTFGDIVYLAGVTADPSEPGDVKAQTRQVLARIDALLARAGTHKSKMLTAQVWLTDMDLFASHNDAWNEWVDPKNPPVRACLLSPQLWRPGLLVEIMATAAR